MDKKPSISQEDKSLRLKKEIISQVCVSKHCYKRYDILLKMLQAQKWQMLGAGEIWGNPMGDSLEYHCKNGQTDVLSTPFLTLEQVSKEWMSAPKKEQWVWAPKLQRQLRKFPGWMMTPVRNEDTPAQNLFCWYIPFSTLPHLFHVHFIKAEVYTLCRDDLGAPPEPVYQASAHIPQVLLVGR